MNFLKSLSIVLFICFLSVKVIAQEEVKGKKSAAKIIEKTIEKFGVEAAVKKFNELKIKSEAKYSFDEAEFNSLGYRLLKSCKLNEAIGVFKLNIDAFPESWKAWEGLGESYNYKGNMFEEAVESFRKSLELNAEKTPKSKAQERLQGLRKGWESQTRKSFRYKPGENTGLYGEYLGQTLPGVKPEVFAPGIVCIKDNFENTCTFSPDGKECYFSNGEGIMVCRLGKDGWTAPEKAPFSGFEPHFSLRGDKLFFVNETDFVGIWMMERSGNYWGDPKLLGPGMYISTTKEGTVYTTDISGNVDGGVIVRYRLVDGKYNEPEVLKGGINSPYAEAHPCIAPDESFIIFDSTRPEGKGWADFYVCFRNMDGSWSEAISLGDKIKTAGNDICASLSPDGKYLFFTKNMDIYWVSTEILKTLKPGK